MSKCKCDICINAQRMRLLLRCLFLNVNVVDCVCAVGNAFYILSNVDISSRGLKEMAIREHLLQCIKVVKFVEFPESEPNEIVLYCPEISVKFDVFCTCRLLFKDLNMAQCGCCMRKYHTFWLHLILH